MRLCASRYVVSWRATIFSTIFETNDERHVRNWPVVVWIARIQPLALEDRNQDGSLLGRRQSSFTDGAVAEDGDEREQDIDKLLQQRCRKRVKLAGFRCRGEDGPALVGRSHRSQSRQVEGCRRKNWRRGVSGVLPNVKHLGGECRQVVIGREGERVLVAVLSTEAGQLRLWSDWKI